MKEVRKMETALFRAFPVLSGEETDVAKTISLPSQRSDWMCSHNTDGKW